MRLSFRSQLALLFALANAAGYVCASDAHPFKSLLEQHCASCHNGEKPKGDWRIDELTSDFTDKKSRGRWEDVLEQLATHAMPPKDKARVAEKDVHALSEWVTAQSAAALAANKNEGRVVLRRLNRVEYENTVHDLFDVHISIKDILPEDTTTQGFDNVGAALNVSPVLMERYLEAADAVLNNAVLPVHKLESKIERHNLYDSLPSWYVKGTYKQEEGVILFHNSGRSPTDLRKFKAPAPGRYKFRISASAYNSQVPVPMDVLLGNFVVSGFGGTRHHGYFDAPSGKPAIIEFEDRLYAKNDTIKVTPLNLPSVYLNEKNMAEYPGPGLHIHWIEIEGPFPDAWPTESYRRVYGDVDPKSGTLADAEKLLKKFLPKAFRRPTTDDEAKPYIALVAKSLEGGQTFDAALRCGIKGVLASPKFLYFRETPGALDDFALASRLSYFLWSTMPDDALIAAAASGTLHKSEVLHEHVERLLKHPKAKQFTENFLGQWLGLRKIAANAPDKSLYPEFDELLQWSMEQESHLFFEEMLKENLSVKNIVDSDFAMLNGRLAQHYGISGIEGVAFRKVPLKPEYHRGGILTQGSVLKITANGTTTSPVLRGAWVLDRIIGKPAPPPPPNVPAIEPDIRGAVTIREQLAKHRQVETCASCHSRIDPPGFALESYDVIGGWRENYRAVGTKNKVNNRVGPLAKYLAAYQYGIGLPVECGDVLPDGRKFANIAEFKKLMLASPEQIARPFTEKLTVYATGHTVGLGERKAITAMLNTAQKSDYGLRSLVHAVVASELFLDK